MKKGKAVMAALGAAAVTAASGAMAFGQNFSPVGGSGGTGGSAGVSQGQSQGYSNGEYAGAITLTASIGGATNNVFTRSRLNGRSHSHAKVKGKNSNRGANGGKGGRGGNGANHF